MANKLYEETSIQDIAKAIREKNDTSATYKVSEMGSAIRAITTGVEPTEHLWNQIPTLVKNYLDNVVYDPSDYTVSSIADYAPSTADKNNTYPIGLTLETSEGTLDREGYELSVLGGNTTIYNDIPNKYTEYVVRNNGVISKVGTLRPTGFLRQIKASTANMRDLGGWSCDGGTVKYGKLFRGGEFQTADLDVFLNQLRIRHELNLRGTTEAEEARTILRDYVGFTCPELYTWYTIADTYKEAWKEILRCVFDCATENKPLFFHCAGGADRTGTVACIIEAVLGVSQSDIDKDYELTCFNSGVSTDTVARRRNESEWSGLINQINALTVGNTFRDKVLNWVFSLGFTVDEVNAFRTAMIDGTPDIIMTDIGSFSISKSGENVTYDNEDTTVVEYQPYVVNITPDARYLIKSVTVKMDGVDITKDVFEGAYVTNGTFKVSKNGKYDISDYKKVTVDVSSNITNHTVTKTLSETSSNNSQTEVVNGQSYGELITVNDGYKISNITVKMGGTNITSSVCTMILEGEEMAYTKGLITIPNVTGDIEITVTTEVQEVETVPITWVIGKTCTYTVGNACTESVNSSYMISENIPVVQGETYELTKSDGGNLISSGKFTLIELDSNDIVTATEEIKYDTCGTKYGYTPSSGVTQLKLRGYSSVEAEMKKLVLTKL